MSSDPTYNINVSGDIKQMLKELGTEKGKEIALHGGGGNKAQNERAAALTAILAARSRIKEESKNTDGETEPIQSFSIVDAASASVHGRSAAAAKAASSDKTAARIAMHMAGERTPVNATMVSLRSFICTNTCTYDFCTNNHLIKSVDLNSCHFSAMDRPDYWFLLASIVFDANICLLFGKTSGCESLLFIMYFDLDT